ncbi:ricin-type beta-trefoil lectin domain protein [Sphingomonas canadensis]|uniref:Ricin-type beta-trefoil lectin domain protein n=1 Tax=Sphingomonas canadensis TaxID=1219257 RepID=A0ABW3H7E9_9SPHN|nr:ricin-type beta-trefoil lectin domain protein [Sphingomonas canadensis]MCW3836024.1 ricin-type beta-trefoil lectin domain protein [Sphingomonas canadensis]
MRNLGLVGFGLLAAAAVAGASPAHAQSGPKNFRVTAKMNLCIDVASGRTAPGTPVQLWHCNGKAPQQFILDPAQGKVRFAMNMDMCVDSLPGDTRLQLVRCDRSVNKWRYDAAKKRFTDGMATCWDVPSGKFNPQQRLQVWQCNGLTPQSFTMINL